MTFQLEVIYIYEFIFLLGAYSSLSRETAHNTVPETVLPLLQTTPGSNTCETFKSLFGLTYRQMREKKTNYTMLKIDLITKEKNVKLNDTKNIKNIFKTAKSVVLLIHGFMESSDGVMVQTLAGEYLKKNGTKVFAVDGRNVIGIEYFISTTHARFLADELGRFLSEIIKNGENALKITIVGHSLGAHIAGIAGKIVYENTGQLIGRITGLDPARPCFSNVPADERLDSTDAVFVDVIHTNAGVLGLKEPVGHVDFYPNGGISQSGCILTTCHHSRAWELFSESINYPDHFPGRKCENWTKFQNGGCVKNEVAYIGVVPGSIVPGNYYLTTAASSPFGLGPSGSG